MMDTIFYTDPYKENHISQAGDFYFDIETTGLRRSRDYAWVWGYSSIHGNEILSKQVYISSPEAEKESLAILSQDLANCKRIITYNGIYFDLPFLDARAQLYNLELPWPKTHLDLFQITRANSKFLHIGQLSLKNMERRMNIERIDPLGGKETLKIYEFVRESGDERLKRALLNHNYYDIKNLVPLMEILTIIKQQKTLSTSHGTHQIHDFYQRGNTLYVDIWFSHQEDIHLFTPQYTLDSQKGSGQVKLALKKALHKGRPVHYLSSTGKVVVTDILFFPIIKEEVLRICQENQL